MAACRGQYRPHPRAPKKAPKAATEIVSMYRQRMEGRAIEPIRIVVLSSSKENRQPAVATAVIETVEVTTSPDVGIEAINNTSTDNDRSENPHGMIGFAGKHVFAIYQRLQRPKGTVTKVQRITDATIFAIYQRLQRPKEAATKVQHITDATNHEVMDFAEKLGSAVRQQSQGLKGTTARHCPQVMRPKYDATESQKIVPNRSIEAQVPDMAASQATFDNRKDVTSATIPLNGSAHTNPEEDPDTEVAMKDKNSGACQDR